MEGTWNASILLEHTVWAEKLDTPELYAAQSPFHVKWLNLPNNKYPGPNHVGLCR